MVVVRGRLPCRRHGDLPQRRGSPGAGRFGASDGAAAAHAVVHDGLCLSGVLEWWQRWLLPRVCKVSAASAAYVPGIAREIGGFDYARQLETASLTMIHHRLQALLTTVTTVGNFYTHSLLCGSSWIRTREVRLRDGVRSPDQTGMSTTGRRQSRTFAAKDATHVGTRCRVRVACMRSRSNHARRAPARQQARPGGPPPAAIAGPLGLQTLTRPKTGRSAYWHARQLRDNFVPVEQAA